MVSGGMRYVVYFIKFYIYPTGTIRSLQRMFTCWNWVIFNDLLDILGCIFIAIEVIIHVATWLSWEYFLKLTFKGGR